MRDPTVLPVDEVVEDVRRALADVGQGVLVAPPGAGKTTRLPVSLLDAAWLAGRKILLLEPRRLAARAAAERMAALRGEAVGQTIGLRARLDTRIGSQTRIEVVTEGVFTRQILDDPALEGIGCVIFDEFHERSLDADLGLALALDCRAGLRDDLRLLVMSATLDEARVAGLLGGAPVIRSDGRAHPVETRYDGRDPTQRPDDRIADVVARAVRTDPGSALVFLPGVGEIRRVAERLAERVASADIDIVELHGNLDPGQQARAIRPASAGRRKIVLATSIAQTSITIEGVRIVVDSGLERVPRYEPGAGITRLETVRVSRATADQRRGRAGRTEPGVCYRLWAEPETMGLPAFTSPEILAADLAPLLLDCAAWGVTEPATLKWLDPPPAGALAAARDELSQLGALEPSGALTDMGRQLRGLPLPPRLARMVLEAARLGCEREAALIAALLVERGLGGASPDLDERLQAFRRDRGTRAEAMRQLAGNWARQARTSGDRKSSDALPLSAARLLALAFPDRIGRARGASGQFLLVNGRAGQIDTGHALSRETYIVAADLTGAGATARIQLAARLDPDELVHAATGRIESSLDMAFDPTVAGVRARTVRRLGAIVFEAEPRAVPIGPATTHMLLAGIVALGIGRLPWSPAQLQLRDRVAFVRAAEGPSSTWPDLSDASLAAGVSSWLAPFVASATRLADITAGDLGQALDALIPYNLKRRLEDEAPTHFLAPTGNRHPIDYDGEGAPALRIRVQELFGSTEHPTIANGRLPLTLHLLSPAQRPLQITRDLPRFWAGSWRDVKAEMKGRYPKHVWPDDPANAAPTARAKPRK